MGRKLYQKEKATKKGFTIIEGLMLLFVFSVVSLSVYQATSVGIWHILEARMRISGINLANEKMEILRNLPYDQVAVVGGVPSGNIAPTEQIILNGRQFNITTDVLYVDDPDDGTVSDTDTVPNDYKVAHITVAWGEKNGQDIDLFARFVPSGVETTTGGGTIRINTQDSSGTPVPNVNVNVVNTNVSPSVNLTTQTDASGSLLIPGAPEDTTNGYVVTLSKSGYETMGTLPPYNLTPYNPTHTHLFVSQNGLSVRTFEINQTTTTTMQAIDPFGATIDAIEFHLTGGKVLGSDPITSEPVYNHNDDHTTNSSGEVELTDFSSGEYVLTLNAPSDTSYLLWKVNPGDDVQRDLFDIEPGSNSTIEIVIMEKSFPSLFYNVTDTTGTPVQGVSVRVENTTLGYDVTQSTDKYGYAFFPQDTTPLVESANYEITVSKSGYDDETETVVISGLTEGGVSLTSD
ncbi:MAG: carboxypeptidase regulatory-like domain-containing protein [Candidatus Moranbacteria bacterium]|nr:carboxypeptidase regulatory-like domain-containing protein [Candidatus Moranbacteria bacterium]